MKNAIATPPAETSKAAPRTKKGSGEVQPFGTLAARHIGLKDSVRQASVKILNQILADTITLRDLYKKHHWQTAGPTFYSLHLLFDKHYAEQAALVDEIAERIQQLGGVSLAMAADIAEATQIPRPPKGSEEPAMQLKRLLDAHAIVIETIREGADKADDGGDDGTNDLLVSGALRTNEMQVWFLSEHLEQTDLLPN